MKNIILLGMITLMFVGCNTKIKLRVTEYDAKVNKYITVSDAGNGQLIDTYYVGDLGTSGLKMSTTAMKAMPVDTITIFIPSDVAFISINGSQEQEVIKNKVYR